jgi:hypothetical protein
MPTTNFFFAENTETAVVSEFTPSFLGNEVTNGNGSLGFGTAQYGQYYAISIQEAGNYNVYGIAINFVNYVSLSVTSASTYLQGNQMDFLYNNVPVTNPFMKGNPNTMV